jgi:hypothetical protein
MKGYDLALAESIRQVTHVPMTILGGAGAFADLSQAVAKFGVIGAAAGSLFVFKGTFRAVVPSPAGATLGGVAGCDTSEASPSKHAQRADFRKNPRAASSAR